MNMSSNKRRPRLHRDAIILAVPLLLLALWAGVRMCELRNTLVVWSCGGNYEFLKDYIREFEKRENCRVRYTAAPVQYLLDLAIEGKRVPNVIIGRAGPGWIALRKKGMITGNPTFFALDPLGIVVYAGNPLDIRTLADLGRPGIRIAQAPRAMRPKSKVPALLMATADKMRYPGLVECWENNTTATAKCGRNMLGPLARGEADAAVAPRSLLADPSLHGKVAFIPIAPAFLLGMKKGKGSMPQCAAALQPPSTSARHDIAATFVAGLPAAKALLTKHGYLALTDPDAQPLKPLLKIAIPKDMPALQVSLAERLEEYGLLPEARRRYLKVVYTFAPSHYVARSLFHAGRLSADAGALTAARRDWRQVVSDFPPPGRCEFDSPVLDLARQGAAAVTKQPYEHWVSAAKAALRDSPPPTATEYTLDMRAAQLFPIHIHDSDPPKNGKREFALGLHLLLSGDADFATRDLLKVVTLKCPSSYIPNAQYLLGVCALQRGMPNVAQRQWQRTLDDDQGTAAADSAKKALQSLRESPVPSPTPQRPPMPLWPDNYGTYPERAMTYGMRLYEHGLPLFAFKEMIKLTSNVYGPHDLAPEARFRAGIAASAFGNLQAATYQWSLCRARYPNSSWAAESAIALAALRHGKGKTENGRNTGARRASANRRDGETEDGKRETSRGAAGLHRLVPKTGAAIRLRIAEEFRKAGVLEGDQVIMEYLKVLTVARPKPGKGKKIVATAMLGLADVLSRTGRQDAAQTQWLAVQKQFPDTPWAKQAANRLKTSARQEGE